MISTLGVILLIVVVLLLLGAVPAGPHPRGWGYARYWMLGLVLLVLIILALTGSCSIAT